MDADSHATQRANDVYWTWPNIHQGAGEIEVRRYFEGMLPWPIELELWTIPVGASEGSHVHDHTDPDGYVGTRELYLILEGTALVTLGDHLSELGPGDAFLAGPLVERGVENIGDTPLRIAIVNDPALHER